MFVYYIHIYWYILKELHLKLLRLLILSEKEKNIKLLQINCNVITDFSKSILSFFYSSKNINLIISEKP